MHKSASNHSSAFSASGEAGGSPTVLLVNDDRDSLFIFQHAVKRTFPRAKLLVAGDGDEALELLGREAVSVIVTDNRMARVSGIALTQKVRETMPSVPIIMVTAGEEKREEALRAGVTVFDSEGTIEGLVAALKRVLSWD